MWYAKIFGMFLNNSRVMNNPKVLSYVGDMDPMEFYMEGNSNCSDKQLITTLDHQSTQLSNPTGDLKINHTHYLQLTPQCT